MHENLVPADGCPVAGPHKWVQDNSQGLIQRVNIYGIGRIEDCGGYYKFYSGTDIPGTRIIIVCQICGCLRINDWTPTIGFEDDNHFSFGTQGWDNTFFLPGHETIKLTLKDRETLFEAAREMMRW